MASIADSAASFSERLREIGITAALIDNLNKLQLDTASKFAWVVGIPPGTKEADDLFVDFVENKVQAGLSPGLLASLRRAWAESHTWWLHDMKHRIDHTSEGAPRKMARPERGARQEEQRKRLGGVPTDGSFEPSHALIDMVAQMKEEGLLRVVELHQCTSRTQELMNQKKDQKLVKLGAQGTLQAINMEQEQRADLTSDYRVRQALQRKSLAFDQLDLVPYDFLESWHNFLFDLLQRQAVPQCQPIQLHQILEADKQLHTAAAQKLGSKGVARLPDGTLPAMAALEDSKSDPHVLAALRPLPTSSQSKRPAEPGRSPMEKRARTATSMDGPNKGKGKGKRQRFTVPLPEQLRGLNTKTTNGSNICFNFNLSRGCTSAKVGGTCSKGTHMCMRCYGEHGAHECPRK